MSCTTWSSELWISTCLNLMLIQVNPHQSVTFLGLFYCTRKHISHLFSWSGLTEADIELDIGRLKTITSAMLTQIGVGHSVQGLDEHIHEVWYVCYINHLLLPPSNFSSMLGYFSISPISIIYLDLSVWRIRTTLSCSISGRCLRTRVYKVDHRTICTRG